MKKSMTVLFIGLWFLLPSLVWAEAVNTAAANESVRVINAGIETTATPLLDMRQTWNASGTTFPGFKITITDTASAAGSLPFQILCGAAGTTTCFSVSKTGNIQLGANTITAGPSSALYLVAANANPLVLYTGAVAGLGVIGLYTTMTSSQIFGFVAAGDVTAVPDTALTRISAGSMALGNGTATDVSSTLSLKNTIVNGLRATSAAAPTIASTATIAPTTSIVFVSGTTNVVTITPPSPISLGGGHITIIPTGIFVTTTAGNIALASTTVVSKALIMTYDVTTTKWYPSY